MCRTLDDLLASALAAAEERRAIGLKLSAEKIGQDWHVLLEWVYPDVAIVVGGGT